MAYTNSPLVDIVSRSPNHSGQRVHKIDTLTPHCTVGQVSARTLGNCFPAGREASCNYGIGYDGKVVLVVDEANRSWCSSSRSNDQRAVTIECASDAFHPYAMNDKVYNKLVSLCADICRRNGLKKVLWLGSKEKTLSYEPKDGECVLTAHRWFANKSCPGDWLYSRYGKLANDINAALCGARKPQAAANTSGGQNTGRKPQTPTKPAARPSGKIAIDGSWGPATTRALQAKLKTTQDGIVSNQAWSDARYLPACSAASWEWCYKLRSGSGVIRALQKLVGAEADGWCGKNTVKALQKYLQRQGYKLAIDGSCGPATVRALQSWING